MADRGKPIGYYWKNGSRRPIFASKGINKDTTLKEQQIARNAQEAKQYNAGDQGQTQYESELYKSDKFKNGYGETDTSDAGEFNGEPDSLSANSTDGKLSSEREELHRKIIDDYFKDKEPAKGQPIFYMTGGGSASGKGRFRKDPDEFMGQSKNCIVIDSDDIKKKLPEWDYDNPNSAGYLHEESSALAKRIMKVARENNYDYMLDGTGDGKESSLRKKIKEAKDAGYKVHASYMTTDMETAFERNEGRWKREGRLVPYKTVKNTHMEVSKLFPKVAKDFDIVWLWDNSGPKPILIGKGGSGSFTVLNQDLYDAFLNKAKFTDNPYFFDDLVKNR